MRTDFSIRVSIDLGLTEQLVEIVKSFMGDRGRLVGGRFIFKDEDPAPEALPRAEKIKTEQPVAEAPAATPTAAPGKRGGKAKAEQPVAQEPAASEQAAEAEQPAVQEPAKEPTGEDIRAAMHHTRQRIEGENYKENTDGELYKKYHKPLSAQFRQIAAFLGADKPSTLPADKRAEFIKQCEELYVAEDGTITCKVPF